jgi:valyl-tRNA synthetase
MIDPDAESNMRTLQEVINAIRNIRGEMSVPPGKNITVVMKVSDEPTARLLDDHRRYMFVLTRAETITISPKPEIPKPAARAFLPGMEIHVPLKGLIDLDKEEARLRKELTRVEAEISASDAKLSSEKFVSRAPEHVVQATREKREELARKAQKLKTSIEQLHGG